MQHEVMLEMLMSLNLHGMEQALGDLATQDSPAYQSAVPILSRLLKWRHTTRWSGIDWAGSTYTNK